MHRWTPGGAQAPPPLTSDLTGVLPAVGRQEEAILEQNFDFYNKNMQFYFVNFVILQKVIEFVKFA